MIRWTHTTKRGANFTPFDCGMHLLVNGLFFMVWPFSPSLAQDTSSRGIKKNLALIKLGLRESIVQIWFKNLCLFI